MRKFYSAVAICCLVIACSKETGTPEADIIAVQTQRSIEVIADEYLAAMLERNPQIGTYYSLPGARHDRLIDNSLHALLAWEKREDSWLLELDEIGSPSDVGSRDWVTFGILYEALAGKAGMRVCRSELWNASTATAHDCADHGSFRRARFISCRQPARSPEGNRIRALARYSPPRIT